MLTSLQLSKFKKIHKRFTCYSQMNVITYTVNLTSFRNIVYLNFTHICVYITSFVLKIKSTFN